MYTTIDVLIIAAFTILATSIITMICFSCAIVNSTEKEKEEIYRQGFSDGRKVDKHD